MRFIIPIHRAQFRIPMWFSCTPTNFHDKFHEKSVALSLKRNLEGFDLKVFPLKDRTIPYFSISRNADNWRIHRFCRPFKTCGGRVPLIPPYPVVAPLSATPIEILIVQGTYRKIIYGRGEVEYSLIQTVSRWKWDFKLSKTREWYRSHEKSTANCNTPPWVVVNKSSWSRSTTIQISWSRPSYCW